MRVSNAFISALASSHWRCSSASRARFSSAATSAIAFAFSHTLTRWSRIRLTTSEATGFSFAELDTGLRWVAPCREGFSVGYRHRVAGGLPDMADGTVSSLARWLAACRIPVRVATRALRVGYRSPRFLRRPGIPYLRAHRFAVAADLPPLANIARACRRLLNGIYQWSQSSWMFGAMRSASRTRADWIRVGIEAMKASAWLK